MKISIIAACVIVFIGMCIGIYFWLAGPAPGTVPPQTPAGQAPDSPGNKTGSAGAPVTLNDLSAGPGIQIQPKSPQDIAVEKMAREALVKGNLPRTASKIVGLTDGDAPLSAEKMKEILGSYGTAEQDQKAVYEIAARKDPGLRQKLYEDVLVRLESEKPGQRISGIKSAVMLQAFDQGQKARIRSLLADESTAVKSEAVTYAGWSRDTEAFEEIMRIINSGGEARAVAAGLHSLGSIGSGREDRIIPVLKQSLAHEDPEVRQAALSSAFRMDKTLADKELEAAISVIAKEDPYTKTIKDKTVFPLRDQAAAGLKMYRETH